MAELLPSIGEYLTDMAFDDTRSPMTPLLPRTLKRRMSDALIKVGSMMTSNAPTNAPTRGEPSAMDTLRQVCACCSAGGGWQFTRWERISGRENVAGKIPPARKVAKFSPGEIFAACDQQLHCEFRHVQRCTGRGKGTKTCLFFVTGIHGK